MQAYELISVRPMPDKPGLLAIVSFGLKVGGFQPVIIGHEEKADKGPKKGEYIFYPDAEFRDGSVVIKSAFLREGKTGPFLTGAFRGVPFAIREAIVREAVQAVNARANRDNNNNSNHNENKPIDPDDSPL